MEGYRVKEYGMPVKRYCQALDLKKQPGTDSGIPEDT